MCAKRFSEEEKAKIVRFHGEGLSGSSIAYLVGRSPCGVRYFLRGEGFRIASAAEASSGLSEEDRLSRDKRIARRYGKGATSTELAKEFGLAVSSINDILERKGIERRPRWLSLAIKRKRLEGRPLPRGVSSRDLAEMVRLYVDLELSACAIAKRLGRHRCQVQHHLAKAGVKMRSWEEAKALRSAQDRRGRAAR